MFAQGLISRYTVFMESDSRKSLPHWRAIILSLGIGILIGAGSLSIYAQKPVSPSPLLPRILPMRKKLGASKNFNFTNPLLLCDNTEPRKSVNLKPLENTLTSAIDNLIDDKNVAYISVYFRDLDKGRWTGVNENRAYSPASLLKVPTMMAFLKFAETNPKMLSKAVFYEGSFDKNKPEYFKPEKSIQAGHSYTIEELIQYMVAYSDNNATWLIFDNLNPKALEEIYSDLEIDLPTDKNADITDFMTTKLYARFFRVLYNTTYLNEEFSEKALSLLSNYAFPRGLVEGIPKNLPIAEKFGERNIQVKALDGPKKELHDCGIIYYPGHPYILCVMTKGYNFDKLADAIKNISRVAYTWVDEQYKTDKVTP